MRFSTFSFAALVLALASLVVATDSDLAQSPSGSELERRAVCVASHCHGKIPRHSRHVCKANKCSFACVPGYVKKGNACNKVPSCKASLCKNKIPNNSHHVCKNAACTFSCNDGHRLTNDGKCAKIIPCVANKCKNVIPADSTRICSSKGVCAFTCNAGLRYNGKTCVPGLPACKALSCHNNIPSNSHHVCRLGECDFSCNTGYHADGASCKKDKTQCTASSQCTRSKPAHTHVVCEKGACVVECNNGYATNASGACVANSATCGPDACEPLEDGHVSCSGDNKCTYSCVNGFKLYKSNGSNVCLKLASDPENCGAVGNGESSSSSPPLNATTDPSPLSHCTVCPHGYLGQAPVCKTGTCQNLHLAA